MDEQKRVDELTGLIGQAIDHNSFLGDERMGTINMQGIAKELIAHGVVVQELDGCEYCEEYEDLPEHFVSGNPVGRVFDTCIQTDENGRWHLEVPSGADIGIKFCPMCGRRLPQPTKRRMIMTDNEIVIALRAVAEKYKGKFVATCETNISEMATDAADHIERLCDENNFLKAEIERLNETFDNIIRFLPACTDCEGKTPYGERTEKCVFEIDPSYCGKKAYELFVKMRTELETAKAEARKEFAEKLVAIYENDKTYDRPNAHTLVMTLFRNIDNLVKEMEG